MTRMPSVVRVVDRELHAVDGVQRGGRALVVGDLDRDQARVRGHADVAARAVPAAAVGAVAGDDARRRASRGRSRPSALRAFGLTTAEATTRDRRLVLRDLEVGQVAVDAGVDHGDADVPAGGAVAVVPHLRRADRAGEVVDDVLVAGARGDGSGDLDGDDAQRTAQAVRGGRRHAGAEAVDQVQVVGDHPAGGADQGDAAGRAHGRARSARARRKCRRSRSAGRTWTRPGCAAAARRRAAPPRAAPPRSTPSASYGSPCRTAPTASLPWSKTSSWCRLLYPAEESTSCQLDALCALWTVSTAGLDGCT